MSLVVPPITMARCETGTSGDWLRSWGEDLEMTPFFLFLRCWSFCCLRIAAPVVVALAAGTRIARMLAWLRGGGELEAAEAAEAEWSSMSGVPLLSLGNWASRSRP